MQIPERALGRRFREIFAFFAGKSFNVAGKDLTLYQNEMKET